MNCCCFSGNLTRDPEVRQAGQGSTLSFTLAVQTGYGENKSTMFIGCSAYGKEKLAQYLYKGAHVTVSGELSEREYQGKKYLNLRVRDLDLPRTGGSFPGSGQQNHQSGGLQAPPQERQQAPAPETFATETPATLDNVPF